MWKLDKNNEAVTEIAAIVDWQFMHEGSPMTDLASLLVNTTTSDVRREAEEFIIDFYHGLLEKEMKEAYDYMYLAQVYGVIIFGKLLKKYFKTDPPRLREAKIDMAILRCRHAMNEF
ncbi:hypothetical protein FO519_009296 [Halicephalobus sp. NKZ332]|nr:hypothetical protein FO519_009296 [Halicephalobus sp. NKZ332]